MRGPGQMPIHVPCTDHCNACVIPADDARQGSWLCPWLRQEEGHLPDEEESGPRSVAWTPWLGVLPGNTSFCHDSGIKMG